VSSGPRIAIDAMGGDGGPAAVVAGACRAWKRRDDLTFMLFGDEAQIAPELAKFADLSAVVRTIHCDDAIRGEDKPAHAIRRAKTSSMGRAIAAVKAGEADALVSGGNTGALMAMSKLSLRTLPGIDRPALVGLVPTLGDQDSVMLDLGANTECDVNNLVQFALMGAAYARVVLDLAEPRVRLLNIGSEAQKGTGDLKDAAALLAAAAQSLRMRFDGFIEGHQMNRGDVDVIVTDGFSGNIALKTMEGTARYIADLIRRAFKNSIRSKVGFAISRPATKLLRHHLDPNNHNGGVFLGLNGLVVKSHGGADEIGIANAIRVAARTVRQDLIRRITEDLEQVGVHTRNPGKVAAE
jgi:glycerol-3-phosphate acyltransferase PlsX